MGGSTVSWDNSVLADLRVGVLSAGIKQSKMSSYQNQSRSLKSKEPEVGVVEGAGPSYSPLASNPFI